MPQHVSASRSRLTLALCTILHAFTHAYGSMLVPLYLLMVADLKLPGVRAASLIVTVYGFVYFVLSYPAGVLADRLDRKTLLGIGLLGNALAITAMGLTRQYELLILFGILAGVFGTIFHPAANALVPAHYPKSPGMVIGLLGIGSGIGFFAGPQYAGWRAQTAAWHFGSVANWQRPLVEAGIAGFIVGIIFLFVAKEARGSAKPQAARGGHTGRELGRRIVILASVLGCRDFAGLASLSLISIYLQKVYSFDAKYTGLVIGSMMLTGIFVNPIAVYLSPGRRRLPALAMILLAAAGIIVTVPLWPVKFLLPVMCGFQAFQLGSYAVSDAAMLERVAPQVRGRVVGIFLTVAGTFSSIAPFVMGWWTDHLRERAAVASAYLPIFGAIGAMMVIASFSMPLIARLGPPQEGAIEPIAETTPTTMEAVM